MTDKAPEVPTMQAFANALSEASQYERPTYNGMLISLSGTLTLAARSLREMAVAPDSDDKEVQQSHEDRCYESQPNMRAHGLESLAKHLAMLKDAIQNGEIQIIREFFEIYRFD